MMTDPKQKVVDIAKSAKPRSTAHKVVSQDDFLDGYVAQVEYKEGSSMGKVWVIATGKFTTHAELDSQLIQQMNSASEKYSSRWDWMNQMFNISGLIALILVGTACYMLIVEKAIPEFLKAALLTITGFYFGGLLNESKGRTKEGG